MQSRILAVGQAVVLGLATAGVLSSGSVRDPADSSAALEGLGVFEPFLGHAWETEAVWFGGEVLTARVEYRSMLGGQFIEATTRASTADGSIYQRFRTVFAFDEAAGVIQSYTFTYEGEVRVAPVEVGAIADGGRYPPLRSGWVQDAGGERIEVRQEIRLVDDSAYSWKVHMAEPGSTGFQPVMQAVWRRGERLID